jgi:hypothetical protein
LLNSALAELSFGDSSIFGIMLSKGMSQVFAGCPENPSETAMIPAQARSAFVAQIKRPRLAKYALLLKREHDKTLNKHVQPAPQNFKRSPVMFDHDKEGGKRQDHE